MPISRSQQGVSLLELLIVVVIITIGAGLAAPSWSQILDNTQRRSTTANLVLLFNVARNTAVSEAVNVTVCPLDNSLKCSKDWSRPVSAFRDPNRLRSVVEEAQIIRVVEPPKRGQLKGATGIRNYFAFRPDGTARDAIGHVIWCASDNDPRKASQIRVNMGGRPIVARDLNGDGIPQDAQGKPLSCA